MGGRRGQIREAATRGSRRTKRRNYFAKFPLNEPASRRVPQTCLSRHYHTYLTCHRYVSHIRALAKSHYAAARDIYIYIHFGAQNVEENRYQTAVRNELFDRYSTAYVFILGRVSRRGLSSSLSLSRAGVAATASLPHLRALRI